MRVRLDLDTLDDAPACSRIARPVRRGTRGLDAAGRPAPTDLPSPGTAPACVRTDASGHGGSPRPGGWGGPAR